MERETLFNALNGLSAYDMGAFDSGILDDSLKCEVKKHLINMNQDGLSKILAEYILEFFENEDAVANGYGTEDIIEFVKWFERNFNYKLF